MVLRGFDKEIGRISKTCRCVMREQALQEKEGCLPQRQVCGLPAGARVFLWINAGARQSQPAETKNVPASQKSPQEVRFFMETAPVTSLFRYRGIAKEEAFAASLAAKIPASQGTIRIRRPRMCRSACWDKRIERKAQKPRRPSYHRIRGLPKKAVKRIAAEMAGPKGIRLFRIPAEKRRPRTQDRIRQSSPPTGPR